MCPMLHTSWKRRKFYVSSAHIHSNGSVGEMIQKTCFFLIGKFADLKLGLEKTFLDMNKSDNGVGYILSQITRHKLHGDSKLQGVRLSLPHIDLSTPFVSKSSCCTSTTVMMPTFSQLYRKLNAPCHAL